MGLAAAWLSKALLPLLAVIVAGTALAVGGAIPAAFAPFGFLSLILALTTAALRLERRTATPNAAWVLLVLSLITLLQAQTLPIGWVSAISPTAGDVWSRCLAPIGATVQSAAISLDPGASRLEALKWSSYAAVCVIAGVIARKRGATPVLFALFAVGVTVALASLAHVVFGAKTVFGVYTPRHAFEIGHIGPILNPNNLAGYLNLNVFVGLGLALSRRPIVSRWLLVVGVICMLAVSIRTGSRGGLAALIVASAVMASWLLRMRRNKITWRSAAIGTAGLLVPTLVFVLLGANKAFWADLLSENAEKLKLISWAEPVISDFRWFGAGRGAFASVFFAYRPTVDSHLAFTHPENFLAQWTAEWGIPTTILACLALSVSLGLAAPRVVRSAALAGAAIGLGGLILHNLVDHSLELPAVGVAAAVVLGAMTADSTQRDANARPEPHWRREVRRWLLIGGFGVSLLAGAVAALKGWHTLDDDRDHIKQLLAGEQQSDLVRAEIVKATLRHPADYYMPLAGAYVARRERQNAIPWIQRALERGPTVGRTHALLGEVLLGRGLLDQGLMELRLAAGYEPGLSDLTARIATSFTQDPEKLLATVPEGRWGSLVLDTLGERLRARGNNEAAEVIDRRAVERDPRKLGPRRRLADARLASLEAGTGLCADRAACIGEIEVQAQAMAEIAPSDTLGPRTRARLLAAQGDVAAAIDLLREGCKEPTGRDQCLLLRAQLLLRNPTAELDAALDEFVAASCTARVQCADANAWVGARRAERGELHAAASAYERAARQDPTAARWVLVADTAERAGLRSTAAAAASEASKLDPTNAALKERLRGLR